MSYDDKVGTYWLSECAAKWLDKSRFSTMTKIFLINFQTLIFPLVIWIARTHLDFNLSWKMPMGLHQVQLSIPTSFNDLVSIAKRRNYRDPESWAKQKTVIKAAGLKLHSCHLLNGKKAATIEFELTDASTNKVGLQIIDMFGNIAKQEFNLREIAPALMRKP